MEHVSHPPRTAPASSTQRLLTAAIGTPIIAAGILLLSGPWFFLFAAIIFTWAAFEYVGIVRPRAPHAPLAVLVVLVPLAALVMTLSLDPQREQLLLLALGALTSVGIGSMVLLARTPLDETLEGLGILAFGLPYFAVPLASIYRLQHRDRGLVFLLLAIVWLGDTAAFYVGSRFG
ncbi:MAG TPA: phosphatidate cytidylyltransferase, partial [Thermoanaerobaculia bacterium]|nr:phosphatidate cytidylyltransferase [Thermoanaerobaculia bacterium]